MSHTVHHDIKLAIPNKMTLKLVRWKYTPRFLSYYRLMSWCKHISGYLLLLFASRDKSCGIGVVITNITSSLLEERTLRYKYKMLTHAVICPCSFILWFSFFLSLSLRFCIVIITVIMMIIIFTYYCYYRYHKYYCNFYDDNQYHYHFSLLSFSLFLSSSLLLQLV